MKRVVYVLPSAALCGGVKVIAEHVSGLIDRGYHAEVWGLGGEFRSWFPRVIPHRIYKTTDDLGVALRSFSGVKVATFWVSASWVKTCLLPGERGYYLIQDEDELTYSGSSVGTSYKLGLTHITESESVTRLIEEKYKTPCINVGIGYDPTIYYPLPFVREQFRVLTPRRTTSAGPGTLKGWDIAEKTMQKLGKLRGGVSLVTFGVEKPGPFPWLPNLHVQRPSDAKLRELYGQSGVFLSTSRHEGFGLPMLEAMACGCPVVCTDAKGNMEFCRDGETALVRNDPESLAVAIDRVMSDRELARNLSVNGIAEASRYRWPAVIDRLVRVFGL